MNIYYQSNSWRGSIAVVANSMEEAITLMEDCPNYSADLHAHPIQVHEITPGLVLCNIGDM